jgi:two-component system sensor histidine kinase BarA
MKNNFFDLKISWSKPGELSRYLRRLFMLFLVFAFIIAIGALVLRSSFTTKLNNLSEQVKDLAQPQEITNVLLELNSAENDFQKASLYGNNENLDAYKTKLMDVFKQLDVILKKYQSESNRYFPEHKDSLERSFDRKLRISQEVFGLKHNFDSLLNITQIEGINRQPKTMPVSVYKPRKKRRITVKPADTTVKVTTTLVENKKGLFGRIRDAISNKNETQSSVKTMTVNREQELRDSITRSMISRQNSSTDQMIKKLNEENNQLTASNKRLVSANLNLIIQLHTLIEELKDIHLLVWEKRRGETLAEYQTATKELNSFTGLAIFFILIFIVLLLVYIRKAGKAEDQYLIENERAVMLAEQKSEMLAIMSHEIRNPLTTITGMIYILNKTMVTPEQQKRLSTISHASSMLMDTVNNVLDVSKINHQKAEALNLIDFEPCEEIKATVAVMSYIAENKHIYLRAEFNGIENCQVRGDAFRLKQVLINLLSNALKYTDEGGITVKVNFRTLDQHTSELDVQVIDTGLGIPKDKQSKLFTRYYQVGRSQDKQGTGLGLYICHQLIELQNGSISVDSDTGKGSNFHFRIPYQNVPKD